MFEDYEKVVALSGIRVEPRALFVVGGTTVVLLSILSFVTKNMLFFLLGFVAADVIVFLPYFIGLSRIRDLEENLPDALKQMATILRAGGTYEVAIREIVSSDYGFLSKQFRFVLEDLESGLTFQDALLRLSERIPSELLSRTITIISDAIKVGGGVSDVLDDVSEDARDVWRLNKERKAKTTMQAMFLFAAAGFLSPFIIGVTQGIHGFFIDLGKSFVASGIIEPSQLEKSMSALELISLALTVYVIIQAAASSVMISLVREGRPHMGIVLMPILLFLAYFVMIGGSALVGLLMHV